MVAMRFHHPTAPDQRAEMCANEQENGSRQQFIPFTRLSLVPARYDSIAQGVTFCVLLLSNACGF
jgi:hypothetical protein